jgi:hypothetical protein
VAVTIVAVADAVTDAFVVDAAVMVIVSFAEEAEELGLT